MERCASKKQLYVGIALLSIFIGVITVMSYSQFITHKEESATKISELQQQLIDNDVSAAIDAGYEINAYTVQNGNDLDRYSYKIFQSLRDSSSVIRNFYCNQIIKRFINPVPEQDMLQFVNDLSDSAFGLLQTEGLNSFETRGLIYQMLRIFREETQNKDCRDRDLLFYDISRYQ